MKGTGARLGGTAAIALVLAFSLGADCEERPGQNDGGPQPPTDGSTPTDGQAPTDGQSPNDGQLPTDSEASTDSQAPMDATPDAPSDAADGGCANTSTDAQNCGACGYECLGGRTCSAGRCFPAWLPLATTNAPVGRDRHAAAGLGSKYIATGGTFTYQGIGTTTAVAYDLATNTWSTYASHVTQRCSHEIMSDGTKLYAFGGITDGCRSLLTS